MQQIGRVARNRNQDIEDWIAQYAEMCLTHKDQATIDAYSRALRQFLSWVAWLPGSNGRFTPGQISQTAIETYLAELKEQGLSVSHRQRVLVAIRGFCEWLVEEQGVLTRNPARKVQVSVEQGTLAPRELTREQRIVLRTLVEREDDPRGAAIFALGYWAGCRVSDVSHLLVEHTHVGPKVGWVHVGHKGGKFREIDLRNEARKPLYEYLESKQRKWNEESPYTFISQRGEQLTEAGIHAWLRALKKNFARADEFILIKGVTFHDLRHDFAHRCRESGMTLEEIAYYLGHVTQKGTPAIQTTVRYTQVSRTQVKDKLALLKG